MENKRSGLLKFFAFIGVIAVIAGICYAVYKYFTPDYLEDTEDDDDFDDDFQDYFEDEDAVNSFADAADDIKEAAADAAEKAEDIVAEAADKAEEAAETVLG